MCLIEKLNFELKNRVSKGRYDHTIRVLEQGKIFAKKYNILESRVEIAILLHDFCKEMSSFQLNEICKNKKFSEILGYEKSSEILHGFAASVYGEEKFGIKDEDILNAVKYHTIGRENMSVIEKIVYLSDGIESGRNYPAVEEIRLLSKDSIDAAIICEVDNKIKYLTKKNMHIHTNTLKMRDYMVKKKK
ncbi:MAG: bis(5'-nucleosyl)-tetraphosphatase (symmetrical) YqeK [Fusobacteriaceae bacterium]